jgi:outer membrane protein assembly factor BamB
MFHHDLQHTGLSPYVGAQTGTVKWIYNTWGYIRSSPVIGSDGTVYISNESSGLWALDSNGDRKWFYGFFNIGTQSTAAIGDDGTVYVGSSDYRLHAINPNGTGKWFFTTLGSVASSPAIGSNGTIYVGCYDTTPLPLDPKGRFYAINPDGSLKWYYDTPRIIHSSPAIGSDGTIYFGCRDGNLYAITDNVSNGVLKWACYADCWNSSPAIGSDGTIYIGGGYDLYAITDNGLSGSQKWHFHTWSAIDSSPAIGGDGTIYVGSDDGALYAITDNGTNSVQKWNVPTGGAIPSSPAIDHNGTIYVGNAANRVLAISDNVTNGVVKWNYATGGAVLSSPAIGSDGTVYIGSDDRKLYAFGSSPHIISLNPNSGVQGKTLYNVIITGNNFTGATAIDFGADVTLGSFTSDNDTQITITSLAIAAGATLGTRDVSVTNSAGTGTKTGAFTILQPLQTVYVNGTTGLNTYDGSSPVHISVNIGPKQTIGGDTGGISVVSDNGTVNVAAGTYHEHGLHLSSTMNLVGAGALATIIDGDASGYVLEVSSMPSQRNTISGFTIRNGAPHGYDLGGGIYIGQSHIVTINDCAIINNFRLEGPDAPSGYGGGIFNNNGIVDMNRCTVSGNSASYRGGGIANMSDGGEPYGTMELTDCTISENRVTNDDEQGGGIWNSGTLTMDRCCISGNHASKGSGIHNMPAATATLTNCTISGNTGNGAGGGIRNWGNMWCYDVTISENHGSVGGGFSNNDDNDINSPPARMYFKNCIVANNTASDGIHNNGYDDFHGTGIQSLGHNIDSENSCYFTDATDQRNTNPLLGTLQNNGGPTSTHAITASSPAFNRGTNDGAPATDQRGVTRPQGTYCDIGAFELELHQSAQVATATGTGTATFATSNGYITALTADTSTPCGTLSGFSFPHGFFSFTITDIPAGSTVTITITLPSNMPTDTQYWKCISGAWVNCTSLLGHNDGDNILTLTIKDGGLGDADGQADGKIADPGAPAVPVQVPVQVPVMPAPAPRRAPLKPAQMSVQYLSIDPRQTFANQPVTISTNVVNTGDEAGNLYVALKINGQVEQTKTVSVGPQGSQPVKFTVTRAQPGTYAVDILGQRGSFTILGAGAAAPAPASEGLIAILIVVALIIATAVVLLFIFRRFAR